VQSVGPIDLEVELIGLDEPGRREDLKPVGRVDEFELAPLGWLRRALEHERADAAAAGESGPHEDGTASRVDVLTNVGLGDDPRAAALLRSRDRETR
jgi:hypothetical protein